LLIGVTGIENITITYQYLHRAGQASERHILVSFTSSCSHSLQPSTELLLLEKVTICAYFRKYVYTCTCCGLEPIKL